ncbi:glycoside hydrolase family 30 protein [Pedobacter chitinilyticus]|uniref:Glucosylceramidase n=1 Tax=Pedobacter chitinilyticus TaxID=2233776 RepID=A0A443YR75_9SPHI|nr:glycoside hydrolase family 30 beta sandwich domain-containing protein [Pedobacter chitinilyticus]RWU06273.1 glucosylceramidase [Pedobacter chitinilyticus]
MKKYFILTLSCLCWGSLQAQKQPQVWLTDVKQNLLFVQQNNKAENLATGENTISIDPSKSYQSIDGFGYTLTGGSAQHLLAMEKSARKAILTELFATDQNNIGTSYLRLSIGASDLNEQVFSYNDLPEGETDLSMSKFDLGPDKKEIIPVLKEILAINPKVKLMGSPWSPPAWMKTNNATKGGSLKPEFYDAYALYFVKYIQAMKANGITIDAITVQNEPLHPGNNPSLLMLAADQAIFVKKHLGPVFKQHKISTKIIVYDHNADRPDYPISILDDKEAKPYIDGSAFHLYGGKIEALSKVHEAHPDKNIYFTEQWVGAPGNMAGDFPFHVKHLIIGATRNWAKTVLEWNLAADGNYKPHTPGGCDRCLGAVTIEGNKVTRNPAYYIIAQAAKFVRPGSVRIASNEIDGLANVAFKTPEGKTVLIVLNVGKEQKAFTVALKNEKTSYSLAPNAAATLVW